MPKTRTSEKTGRVVGIATRVDEKDALPKLSEDEFQSQVTQLATLLGWTFFHVYDSRKCPGGWPDLVLVRPPRLLFRELKTTKGIVSADQTKWLDLLTRSGQDADVWRPEDFEQIKLELI